MFAQLPVSKSTPVERQCISLLFNSFRRPQTWLQPFGGCFPSKLHNKKCRNIWSSTESRHARTWTKHWHSSLRSSQLARRAYRNHLHLLEQIVVTSFNEGLNNSTFNWELRKLKRESTDHVLTKPLELQAYLELETRNPIVTACGSFAGLKNMTNQFRTESVVFLTNLSVRSKETPIACRKNRTEDHTIFLVAKSEIGTATRTGETKMTHGRRQEEDMELTHKTTGMNTWFRAIGKTIVMIDATGMAKKLLSRT